MCKRRIGVLLCLVMVMLAVFSTRASATEDEMSAQDVVDAMQVGWNLGNSLDSFTYNSDKLSASAAEKLWYNPVTTKQMIDTIANAGFKAVRIPVTYYNHIDKTTNIIDQSWLNRVGEVVNYALDNDLYVILNIHHDTGHDGWIMSDVNTYSTDLKNFKALWSQVANYFKDYGNKVLFQGTNEILNTDKNWDWGTSWDDFRQVHELNQEFINLVRSTGGNNTNRFLVLSTWAASSDSCQIEQMFYKSFDDTATDKLILSVHDYMTDSSAIQSVISRLDTYSQTYDIPIIIDEMGTPDSMTITDRVSSVSEYVSTAKSKGITCFWWDDGGAYGLLNRSKLMFKYPTIVQSMIEAAGGTYVEKTYTNISDINFELASSWKSGYYDWTTCALVDDTSRISLLDYVSITSGSTFKVAASSGYQMLVREMDSNLNYIRHSVLTNGDTITTSTTTKYLAISAMNTNGVTLTFNDYVTLINNGTVFKLEIVK